MQEESKKLKHLEFLQGAIGRMSGNLFLLKGWTVTLIAALFALAAKDANKAYAALAYFPIFVFWSMDAYFLSQERCFRALYDRVRLLDESAIDFSMDTRPFKLDPRNTLCGCLFSSTLLVYYLSLAGLLTILIAMVL